MQGVASTIGDAFSTAFQGIINGSMSAQEALGNFFQSVGQSFVKMAMDIIAKQMVMIVLGFLMKALGLSSGGGLGSAKDNMAKYAPLPEAANGAIFSNGIAKFANGGIVNGPTLFPFADGGAMQMGLMGEAGPEAIMPLQRGPDGALGVRAAMGGNGMGGSSSSILNMSFETSTINGVEYVSRDQLELAMAQTRRQASRDGANKGMAMTLDKIQQSPQTRRRIGM
jgi:lambda family phage tail tape measure protein